MLGTTIQSGVNYGAFSKSFSYSYAANGQKASFTAPDGTTYEYAYGQNNELREVQIPDLGAITISEYAWTRPKTILYPGGSTRELGYDGLMRLKKITSTAPGGTSLLDYSYAYDSSGNIMSKTTEHGDYSYGYDSASRLTSADNPTLEDESYSYDAVGNRTAASNATGSISHNANNELLSYGEIEFLYDENGNMIQKKLGNVAVNYIYNADNRLIRVEDELSGTVIAEYYYDPFGRRLWKEVSGVRTYFFYSDEGLIAEFDSSGNELKSYGYKPDSTWTTDPLFLKQGSQYYFYHNDHLGTPQKLVAQNGAVVWSATYSAFGEADVQIETITNNLRFPGQYVDAETGLHYNFQRYYDPDTGRYVSADPIGYLGGQASLYGYVRNSPIRWSDPPGLSAATLAADELGKAVAASGATAGAATALWGTLTTSVSTLVAGSVSTVAVPVAGAAVGGYWLGTKLNEALIEPLWDLYPVTIPMADTEDDESLAPSDDSALDDSDENRLPVEPGGPKPPIPINPKLLRPKSSQIKLLERFEDILEICKRINPGGRDVPGRAENCPYCAVAFDLSMAGEAIFEAPPAPPKCCGKGISGRWVESFYKHGASQGQEIGNLFKQADSNEITEEIRRAGHGARGIVAILMGPDLDNHFINVINWQGEVYYLDPQ